MTKADYLKKLKHELEKSRVRNVQEILADYEEHFEHGAAKGKSEEDIAQSLGSPSTIASAYKTEHMIQDIKNPETKFSWAKSISVIMRLLIIAPFNFIVLFIPGLITFGIFAGFWGASLGIMVAGFGLLGVFPGLVVLTASGWMSVGVIFTGLGLILAGLVCGMIMFVLTKYVLLGLISYLQWNLKFILEK